MFVQERSKGVPRKSCYFVSFSETASPLALACSGGSRYNFMSPAAKVVKHDFRDTGGNMKLTKARCELIRWACTFALTALFLYLDKLYRG